MAWIKLQDAAKKYKVNRQTLYERAQKAGIATKLASPKVTTSYRVKTRYYDEDALDTLMRNWAKRYNGGTNEPPVSKPD